MFVRGHTSSNLTLLIRSSFPVLITKHFKPIKNGLQGEKLASFPLQNLRVLSWLSPLIVTSRPLESTLVLVKCSPLARCRKKSEIQKMEGRYDISRLKFNYQN